MREVFASLLGTTPGVFVALTLLFMGGCSFMAGQAVASSWRPAWRMLPYGLLMGLADRFLVYALFHGTLLSVGGYIVDTAILIGIGLFAHRLTLARQIPNQYPWLYQRTGLLSWRPRGP
jgi:hypothetical protein